MEKHGGSIVSEKKKCSEIALEGVQRGLLSDSKGEVIPYRGSEDGTIT